MTGSSGSQVVITRPCNDRVISPPKLSLHGLAMTWSSVLVSCHYTTCNDMVISPPKWTSARRVNFRLSNKNLKRVTFTDSRSQRCLQFLMLVGCRSRQGDLLFADIPSLFFMSSRVRAPYKFTPVIKCRY
ncbi:hypothetical protein RRG08_014804 [Elysia crispata]|uniref:Uncharacterized protein n=1 Tax=Elysia crispata TaxID=231223 RepID=A0AAE1D9B1_9GAST|nr:hypothetical protein RRG08_014804 [Elysia crispata]